MNIADMITPQNTDAIFAGFTARHDWNGRGYLGKRALFVEELLAAPVEERDDLNATLATADAMVLAFAQRHAWTMDDLWGFLNSDLGIHYGSCVFDLEGNHADDMLQRYHDTLGKHPSLGVPSGMINHDKLAQGYSIEEIRR